MLAKNSDFPIFINTL